MGYHSGYIKEPDLQSDGRGLLDAFRGFEVNRFAVYRLKCYFWVYVMCFTNNLYKFPPQTHPLKTSKHPFTPISRQVSPLLNKTLS